MIDAVVGGYRIESELGAGGMGTVYRARHELLGRPAAIKFLRSELVADASLVQRFFTEARAAGAIRHPGIVEVLDFGHTPDGRAYLVMELLEGRSLAARLAERVRPAEAEEIAIARGIASALRAAHAKGIVHRDLKPDNVFLVPDRDDPTGTRVKVLDFGVAKLLAETATSFTQDGALMGTPLYMAPEQARAASAIDARADLYSLGCVMYELLAGRPPFVGAGAGEVIAMQMFSEPELLEAIVPGVTPRLAALVARLLAKEPADRPASADEVIGSLGSLAPAGSLAPVGSSTSAGLAAPAAASSSTRIPVPAVPSRSAMPIVAAVITLGIAAGIGGLVLRRAGHDAARPAPATVLVERAAPTPTPVLSPVATPVVATPVVAVPVVAVPMRTPGPDATLTPALPRVIARPKRVPPHATAPTPPTPPTPPTSPALPTRPATGATTANGSPVERDL